MLKTRISYQMPLPKNQLQKQLILREATPAGELYSYRRVHCSSRPAGTRVLKDQIQLPDAQSAGWNLVLKTQVLKQMTQTCCFI